MKRFRFSLQPVTVLRAHRELRAKEVFATSVQAHAQSQADLVQVRARVAGVEAAMTAGRQQAFPAAMAAEALHAYRTECAAESESERALRAAHAAMEQRRHEYITAHRELEVVHRLEEKARTLHRAEGARAEQAEFDDFASRRAARPSTFKL